MAEDEDIKKVVDIKKEFDKNLQVIANLIQNYQLEVDVLKRTIALLEKENEKLKKQINKKEEDDELETYFLRYWDSVDCICLTYNNFNNICDYHKKYNNK
jgi:uncharacterized small protein (DUF1192 family)